jgi:trehalose 6-phosphate synthase
LARLVIVSNRVPVPRARSAPQAGGLAVALKQAMAERDVLWFGWSGHVGTATSETPAETVIGRARYATIDLSTPDHRLYYAGFSNGTLWPLLHWRMGLTEFRRDEYSGYRAVNEHFARVLAPMLRPDDVVWVHDFHLIPLATSLRAMGCRQRIGFFLHVPFPPPSLFVALPQGDALLRDLAAFSLIGVQTDQDRDHLRAALAHALVGARVETFPIGIDADTFAAESLRGATGPEGRRLTASLADRALVLGVDRLDYSKGLPHRLRGFARLLARFPHHRRRVTLLQVAPVSRNEVAQYRALRRELDELAGRINGEHGEPDWNPIRWITRAVPRATLAGYHRLARVGLVTPLRDGMNLVAKEFVAAQNPDDPGVLVLSRFAGAAAELSGAIQVNPHDPDEIAEGLDAALSMDRVTRIARWRRDAEIVRSGSAEAWASRFLRTLEAAPQPATEPAK